MIMKNSKQNSSASGNKQATGSKSTSGGRCCSKSTAKGAKASSKSKE